MNAISRQQTDERAALKRIALYARSQLINAVDELLANFIGDATLRHTRGSYLPLPRERFDTAHRRFQEIAEVLMQWYSNDEFLTSDGSPRPLPKAGKRSLTDLIKRVVGSTAESKSVLSDLLGFGLVEEVDGLYRPPRRTAILGKANVLNLTYATVTAIRLLRTISHNVASGSPPLFERQVTDVTISTADLPLFLRFVEQQAQYLIDSVDDWLSGRRVKSPMQKDGIKVGIGAFAWADLPAKNARRARPKPSKRQVI